MVYPAEVGRVPGLLYEGGHLAGEGEGFPAPLLPPLKLTQQHRQRSARHPKNPKRKLVSIHQCFGSGSETRMFQNFDFNADPNPEMLFTPVRIQVQLPKIMRIRIRVQLVIHRYLYLRISRIQKYFFWIRIHTPELWIRLWIQEAS